jgi:hypothetical protein
MCELNSIIIDNIRSAIFILLVVRTGLMMFIASKGDETFAFLSSTEGRFEKRVGYSNILLVQLPKEKGR